MRVFSAAVVLFVGSLAAVVCSARCVAAIPSDQLLPATTTGYLSIPNVATLEREFDKTQWGQLMADPVMKPFADDLKHQLQQKWTRNHDKLGLTWDDIREVPSGEVGIAKILPSPTKAVTAIVADVTGKMTEARELLKKVDANLTEKHCTRTMRDVGGVTVTIYTHPMKPDEKEPEVAVMILHEKQQQIIACDDVDTALAILKRFDGPRKDSLSHLEAYEAVMDRCGKAAGKLAPHLRWFIEPFGFTEASRLSHPEHRVPKGQDLLKVLKSQGFDCVQGLGGYINCNEGPHDILHRTMIYAPAVKRGPGVRLTEAQQKAGEKDTDRYHLAARMLNFPNSGNHLPVSWIPRDLATYVSFNGDLRNGFEYSKSLVNAMAEDEIFEDVLKSLEQDPSGPRVNIRKELVSHLGQHVMIFSDYVLPITTTSERMLVAIELTEPAPVAEAIRKLMENDPNHKKVVIGGQTVWDVVEDNAGAAVPSVDIDFGNTTGAPKAEKHKSEDKKEEKMLSSKAMAVVNGYLLVATHSDIIRRVIEGTDPRLTLADSVDYQWVHEMMQKLGASNDCCQTFSRTDEEYRPTYELLRSGQMPRSETLMGKLLNGLFRESDEDEENPKVRQQQIDGRKLPEYEQVRRYLGPAGIFVTSRDDGWFATGFFLSKQAPRLAERP